MQVPINLINTNIGESLRALLGHDKEGTNNSIEHLHGALESSHTLSFLILMIIL